MDDNIILLLLGFTVSMIGIMTPIIKLNNSITKLNVTIDNINCRLKVDKDQINKNSETIRSHEIRIDRLEHKK